MLAVGIKATARRTAAAGAKASMRVGARGECVSEVVGLVLGP